MQHGKKLMLLRGTKFMHICGVSTVYFLAVQDCKYQLLVYVFCEISHHSVYDSVSEIKTPLMHELLDYVKRKKIA
jgi:hypothetical protein